jgi:predicted enzyme related to lactoylglutathione lyase
MANLVVHFEIHASEPQKLIDYYSQLLGWTFESYGSDEQPYWVIDTGEGAIGNTEALPGLGINGGLTQRQGPAPEVGAPVNGCNIVVGVEDVDGLMRRGVALGGAEALPATDWPGIGRGGYLLDPDGNVFGLLSPVLSDGTVAMGVGAEA